MKEMSIISAQVKCFLYHERILASTSLAACFAELIGPAKRQQPSSASPIERRCINEDFHEAPLRFYARASRKVQPKNAAGG